MRSCPKCRQLTEHYTTFTGEEIKTNQGLKYKMVYTYKCKKCGNTLKETVYLPLVEE